MGDTEQNDETVFHLCVTCGRLKAEELFESGDCTCLDCYDDGCTDPLYKANPNGEGWIARW